MPARKTTRKTATRKAPAKKAPGRKAPAKKAPGRNAPAKKAPGRKKAPAKKATPRKAARKAPAKKTARKSSARKAPARKSTARKSTARKSTARKSTARKSTSRKTAPRKTAAAAKVAPAEPTNPIGTGAVAEAEPARPPASEVELRAGDRAPEFTLPGDDGRTVSLADFRGKKVVLYFYPKDDTPGCTLEGRDFTRLLPEFEARNAVVFGVSADSVESHQRFKEKCSLGLPLLADTDLSAAQAYGVWKEKNLYGRNFLGIVRSTFLIDEEGMVQEAWPKVNVQGHAEEVLARL